LGKEAVIHSAPRRERIYIYIYIERERERERERECLDVLARILSAQCFLRLKAVTQTTDVCLITDISVR